MRSKFKWIFTLLLAFSMQFSFAQEKTVTGTVTENGLPLPGVSVVVKGTTLGTQTDMDGNYSIKAKTGSVLVFSFIGMKDATAAVGASSKINVAMVAETTTLENVVVTAMGIKRKADAMTSSNQVVKSRELTQASNPNVVQSLVGKVSGLQINQTNSSVNGTNRIVIRASKSLTGNNEALVVIDGSISSSTVLQTIAPESIESVNVMKGMQGSALYGEQGANGVIVVTTKKGSGDSKVVVNVTSSVDFSTVAFLPERQTRYGQGWDGVYYSYENGAWGPEMNGDIVPTGLPQADGTYLMLPYSSRGSDNIKEFFQTGTVYQNSVSLASGDQDSGYYFFNAKKLNNEFMVKGDLMDRTNFNFKAGKKFGKINLNGNFSYVTQRVEQTNSNLYYGLLQTATNIPIEMFADGSNEHGYSYYNNSPYWTSKNDRNNQRRDNFLGTINVGYDINKNINVAYNANVSFIQNQSMDYVNAYKDPYGIGGGDQSVQSTFGTSNSYTRNFYGDLLVNFDYDLTSALNFKLILGNNIQDAMSTTTSVSGSNLSIPNLYNIDNVSSLVNGGNSLVRQRKYSFFGDMTLGYNDYLFLNLTGRNDVTSILPKDKNSYFYPSAGLSFVFTKAIESLRSNNVLNYAKASLNYAKTGGTSSIAAYQINRTYVQATGYPFDGNNSYLPNLQPTLRYNSILDPNIKPEFYTQYEANLNLGFFKDRLTLDLSGYRGTNKDLITTISSSYASGNPNLITNIGETSTKGLEVDLGLTPIKTEDFRWDMRVSYSTYKTMVEKVTDQANSVAIYAPGGDYGIYAEVGQEYPIIKGIAYQRDDQGRIIVNPNTGVPEKTAGVVNLGKTTPDYILGLNTSFTYKGLKLAGVFDFRTGHQFYSGNKQTLAQFGYLTDSAENGRNGFIMPNSSYESAPGVYTENTSIVTGGTSYASYQQYITGTYTDIHENFVLDATAFRMRELTLQYSLPSDMIKKAGLQSLTFGVNARNPFVIFAKENRGYDDPENSVNNGNAVGLASGTSGFSNGTTQYPNSKTYGFTVNLTF